MVSLSRSCLDSLLQGNHLACSTLSGTVHLSGYFMPEDDFPQDTDSEEEEVGEEESEDEDASDEDRDMKAGLLFVNICVAWP